MNGTRVHASGPRDAKIAVVGMAPAREEVAHGLPFVGQAGRILNEALSSLGVPRESVYVTNVAEFPLPMGGSLFDLPSDVQAAEAARLKAELEQTAANVIMVLGDEPLWFLCGLRGILKWRGSILESTMVKGRKCVASVHPAWILRGMFKWLPVFKHVDLARAIAESAYPDIRLPTREALTGPSFKDAIDYVEECRSHGITCVDIEGYGEISCVGIGHRPDQAMCIPITRGSGAPYWSDYEEAQIWLALASLLQDPNVRKVAQNASYEWINFWKHKIYPYPLYIDTMTLHHCLYPDWGGTQDVWGGKKKFDEPGHGLAFINSQYTCTPYYKDDGRKWNPTLGDHQLWIYNCKDVMTTLDAGLQMVDEAVGDGILDFYNAFYIRPFLHSLRMEWFGTKLDEPLRDSARKELNKRAGELQGAIDASVGYHLNVNSPKQMQKLLYQDRGYQVKKNRKTGSVTTDKYVLQYFADKKGDRTLNLVIELRKVRDLLSDVINQELGPDGIMRTHYKLGGTDGTRWSSTESILGSSTNLQNVPREGIARRLFIPD